jgi:hypothetical protein
VRRRANVSEGGGEAGTTYGGSGVGLEGGHLFEDELEQSVDDGLLLLLERLVASVQHVVGVH